MLDIPIYINDLTLEELGNRSSTIAESIIKENGNQKLINLSQRFIAEDEKTFNTEVTNRVEETKKVSHDQGESRD